MREQAAGLNKIRLQAPQGSGEAKSPGTASCEGGKGGKWIRERRTTWGIERDRVEASSGDNGACDGAGSQCGRERPLLGQEHNGAPAGQLQTRQHTQQIDLSPAQPGRVIYEDDGIQAEEVSSWTASGCLILVAAKATPATQATRPAASGRQRK
jgi:hypothetical protein